MARVVGLGGTLAAGGAGGAGNQGPSANGSGGGGPAMEPSNPGAGGSGGASEPPAVSSGGGGGGGYFGGGGGGVDDPKGINSGAGGGGSGFNDPSTTVVSTSTNTGDGSVTMTYPVPATTTTSGVLLDATTGAAIPNSCVVFSPAAFPGRTNYDSVGGDGTWSFTTAESGPFDLAFYTTANGDCSQPILPTPVPSWYINQPLSGTDEHVITPPPGATTVDAGTSGIVACLGATALPTAACAAPSVVLSGHVDTTGPVPLANVCVFVVDASGNGAQAMTDAQGNWSVSGLPAGFNVVVVFVPFFSGTKGPCQGNGGGSGPPVPGPGQLQPVFYGNVWANLADPSFLNDPYTWGVPARGHHLDRAHRQRRRLHHHCGRHRGPQTELQPELPRSWRRTLRPRRRQQRPARLHCWPLPVRPSSHSSRSDPACCSPAWPSWPSPRPAGDAGCTVTCARARSRCAIRVVVPDH